MWNGAPDGVSASVVFDAIEYDAPGEFDYQVVEVEGDAEGVTYDETVFMHHVSVSDNGKGNLEAAWTGGRDRRPGVRVNETDCKVLRVIAGLAEQREGFRCAPVSVSRRTPHRCAHTSHLRRAGARYCCFKGTNMIG